MSLLASVLNHISTALLKGDLVDSSQNRRLIFNGLLLLYIDVCIRCPELRIQVVPVLSEKLSDKVVLFSGIRKGASKRISHPLIFFQEVVFYDRALGKIKFVCQGIWVSERHDGHVGAWSLMVFLCAIARFLCFLNSYLESAFGQLHLIKMFFGRRGCTKHCWYYHSWQTPIYSMYNS